MTQLYFSIYDEKAEVFSQPFLTPQIASAIRLFSDEVANEKSSINKHPSDYKLYHLGEFDDHTGQIKTLDRPKFINHASDFSPQNPEVIKIDQYTK